MSHNILFFIEYFFPNVGLIQNSNLALRLPIGYDKSSLLAIRFIAKRKLVDAKKQARHLIWRACFEYGT
jgi:hypothetical protein